MPWHYVFRGGNLSRILRIMNEIGLRRKRKRKKGKENRRVFIYRLQPVAFNAIYGKMQCIVFNIVFISIVSLHVGQEKYHWIKVFSLFLLFQLFTMLSMGCVNAMGDQLKANGNYLCHYFSTFLFFFYFLFFFLFFIGFKFSLFFHLIFSSNSSRIIRKFLARFCFLIFHLFFFFFLCVFLLLIFQVTSL